MADATAGSGSASSEMLKMVWTGVVEVSATRSATRGKWAMMASDCRMTVFSSSAGDSGDRMLRAQSVVAEDVGPVVSHVIDVRNAQHPGQRRSEQPRLFMGVHDVVVSPAAQRLLQGSEGDCGVEDELAERWPDRYRLDAGNLGSDIAEAGDLAVLSDGIRHEIDFVSECAEGEQRLKTLIGVPRGE